MLHAIEQFAMNKVSVKRCFGQFIIARNKFAQFFTQLQTNLFLNQITENRPMNLRSRNRNDDFKFLTNREYDTIEPRINLKGQYETSYNAIVVESCWSYHVNNWVEEMPEFDNLHKDDIQTIKSLLVKVADTDRTFVKSLNDLDEEINVTLADIEQGIERLSSEWYSWQWKSAHQITWNLNNYNICNVDDLTNYRFQ